MITNEKKLIVGITAPVSVNLLRGQLHYFYEKGFETYLIAPEDPKTRAYCEQEKCTFLTVSIERDISPFQDTRSLLRVIQHFLRVKPDIVNVGTPKMGLLGMFAAKILGVKKRIYTCRGFRYEHETGFKRKILMLMERITGWCAHEIICISPSVKDLSIKDRVFKASKCRVIHKGSSNGINTQRFNPDLIEPSARVALLNQLGLKDHFVFGFVGRLIDRKGITELYEAFDSVYKSDNKCRLLIVGPLEFEQITDKSLIGKLQTHPGIIMPGRTDDAPLFLSIMDVFVLPAWWEGFGNVLVEAAAMGIPVISTKGTGTKDAVKDGYNGILVEVKNSNQLAAAMQHLKDDEKLRNDMGRNGTEWAKNFDSHKIWEGMRELYES